MGSEILHARSIIRPWQFIWQQQRGHDSVDDNDDSALDDVRGRRKQSRRDRSANCSAAILCVTALACTTGFVVISGLDRRLAIPSIIGLILVASGSIRYRT